LRTQVDRRKGGTGKDLARKRSHKGGYAAKRRALKLERDSDIWRRKISVRAQRKKGRGKINL